MPLDCEKQGILFLESGKLIAWHCGDGMAPGPEPWPWTTLRSGSSLGVLGRLWIPASLSAALGYRLLSPSGSQGQNSIENNEAWVSVSREADTALQWGKGSSFT